MRKVNKHSRCKREGTIIVCPICGKEHRVYHFSWCGLSCHNGCENMIGKYEWFIKK